MRRRFSRSSPKASSKTKSDSLIDLFNAIEILKRSGNEIVSRFARTHRGVVYADLRFEVMFHRSSAATNGEPRDSNETATAGFSVSVHVAANPEAIGHGQYGAEIGRLALSERKLVAEIRRGVEEAYGRARISAREKAGFCKRFGTRAASILGGGFAPRGPIRDDVAAVFKNDPRTINPDQLKSLSLEASREVKSLGHDIAFNAVAAMTEIRHELFASTEGSLISQAFAFSQGDCYVVAQSGDGHQESYDTIGQQRGFESIAEGWREELLANPSLSAFSVGLAREAQELAAAPVLKPPDEEVVVVTDPHFNALIAHEIVGHPSEADRALKMEAAYAGRSWFLRTVDENEVGRQIGSPLLSACSDPTLYGYGHYRYDHEGTPGKRVNHIDRGTFRGFMNSRATATALGAEPNGSARSAEVHQVPLIRMSNTFFLPGETAPEKIIGEVEHGYYVCGHQIPSIAESRENFRISARKVYEIDHGRIGKLFRSGSVMADSKRFFMSVDGVGNDLSLIAIPNCGKGQPMQVKRMSNGGPTLRSRTRLGGG